VALVNIDELLADPAAAAELPAGAIPLHAVVLIEYANPSSTTVPQRPRLAFTIDDDLTAWTSIGMLRFALQRELDAVALTDNDIDE